MDTERRLKALIIHRDTGASCAYTAIARSAGWEVSSCEDMGNVPSAVQNSEADVVILDFAPESGFTALRQVRQLDPSLPSILITAHPVDQQEAISLGVKIILPKPPDPSILRQSLAALVTQLPASDFKVLFEFLERCEAARPRK